MGYGQGTGSVSTTNQNVLVESWGKKLADVYLDERLFYALIDKAGLPKFSIPNRLHNWIEYEKPVPTVTVVNDGSSAYVLKVTGTEHEALVAEDVLYCDTVGTWLKVETTPTGVSVSVLKFTSDTALEGMVAADYAEGLVYRRIYTNFPHGGSISDFSAVTARKKVDNKSNYVGVFQNDTSILWTDDVENWQGLGMSRRVHDQNVIMHDHMRDLSHALWLSKSLHIDTGDGRTGMKGLLNFLSQIQTGTFADFTYSKFLDWVENYAAKYNDRDEADLFVNNRAMTLLGKMVDNSADMVYDTTRTSDHFGIRYKYLDTPLKNFRIRRCKELKELFPNDAMFVSVDLPKIGLRPLQGFDTAMYKGIEPNDAKFYADEVYTIMTMEVQNEKWHAALKLS